MTAAAPTHAPALSEEDVRSRILGCWLGKAVGGTLGQNFEGLHGPLDIPFYTPVPTAMIPNDDLDLQVVYAVVMARQDQPVVDRHLLAAAWEQHVRFPWNEYGMAKRNLREGLRPPHTGSYDNWYACGEGAAIRSELWACLAAGDPALAAAYAYEDACFDHDGDGIAAAVFLAAVQSAAFVESDPARLIDIGLEHVPEGSELRAAIQATRGWVGEGLGWKDIHARIRQDFGRKDMTDVRQNTAFVILAWLTAGGFEQAIVTCNNCGEDTDSSTASIGALLGILDPESIPQRWLAPIGRDLVLNDAIEGLEHPDTLDGFTDLVMDLRRRLAGRRPEVLNAEVDLDAHRIPVLLEFSNAQDSGLGWEGRDHTGLRPAGSSAPAMAAGRPALLDGTWTRMDYDEFEDELLTLRYTVTLDRGREVRIMLNTDTDFRVWIDGDYAFGGPAGFLHPSPHHAPAGQTVDRHLSAGEHALIVQVHRPLPPQRACEWVLAVAEIPSYEWIPNALRPAPAAQASR